MTKKTWQMELCGRGSKEMCARNIEFAKEVLGSNTKHGIYTEIASRNGLTGTHVKSCVGIVRRGIRKAMPSAIGPDGSDLDYLDALLSIEKMSQ